MTRRTIRPDWARLRAPRTGWGRRLLLHALAVVILCVVASMAVGRLMVSSNSSDAGGFWGIGVGSGTDSGGGTSGSGDGTRDGVGGAGRSGSRGASTDGPIEYTVESGGRVIPGGAGSRAGAGGGVRGGGGVSVKVRFDPTPRLRLFLQQLDTLDRAETMESLGKFVRNYGAELESAQQLAPVETFLHALENDATMLDALMQVMKMHGPAGKDTMESIFDLKRGEYEERLTKYIMLKQAGVAKDYKLYSYQQRLALIDELRGEFNKSFTFE